LQGREPEKIFPVALNYKIHRTVAEITNPVKKYNRAHNFMLKLKIQLSKLCLQSETFFDIFPFKQFKQFRIHLKRRFSGKDFHFSCFFLLLPFLHFR